MDPGVGLVVARGQSLQSGLSGSRQGWGVRACRVARVGCGLYRVSL